MEFMAKNREFQLTSPKRSRMALEMRHDCPDCGGERTFWRVASTEMHLGEKVKWSCGECGYGFVLIDETVDTSVSA